MKDLTEVRTLKEGRYVIINDEPCVIKSLSHSKTGKHGSAKARIDAIGIFDKQKRSIVAPVTTKIYVPIVERKSGQVLSISNDVAQIMDLEDFSNFDMTIPSELKEKVKEGEEIVYITSMGKIKFDVRT